MSDSQDAPAGGGKDRPGEGAALSQSLDDQALRRPKSRNFKSLGRLIPIMAAHGRDAALALLFLLTATGAMLGLSGALRKLVDQITGAKAAHVTAASIDPWFLLLFAAAVVLALSSSLRYFFVTKLGERVVADLRQALYRHILTLDPSFFLKTRTGEVLSRLTTDVSIIENLLSSSISIALRNLLSLIGALSLLMVVSPRLTGLVLLLFPFVLAPIFLFGKRVRKLTIASQDRFADAVGHAGETLDALETVQAFGREAAGSIRFSAAVDAAFNTSVKRMAARAFMIAMVIVLVFGGVVAVFWLGVHAGLRGEMTWGALIQFAFLAVMAAGSTGALGEVWGDVQKAAGAMDRISELLAAVPFIVAPAAPTPLPTPPRGAIAFERIGGRLTIFVHQVNLGRSGITLPESFLRAAVKM